MTHVKPIPAKITYPPELPVSARREEIAAALRQHQVVIVSGETGSGKTTQLPKICLELGRGREKLIGHTQPRRIAARTVAERIAHETGGELGGLIGYQVRFTDDVTADTAVKVMTDGILLAEIRTDPMLQRYDTIIIDEAHERSLNIDFLLGYLARLAPQRPDLQIIITSATIDSARFAQHFARRYRDPATGETIIEPAPVIEVSGRTYPVEIRYRPLDPEEITPEDGGSLFGDEAVLAAMMGASGSEKSGAKNTRTGKKGKPRKLNPANREERELAREMGKLETLDEATGICRAVDELLAEAPGDILVFLAGERDIRDTDQALADHLGQRYLAAGEATESARADAVEVMPLYARLSAAEQQRIFAPHPRRRIVLATNVAETSITVPGIRYVIDTGVARISRFSNKTKVQRLPIEEVSQASANQRSGRCGRLSDGIAIRLYSRADFEQRPEYTEPEILRTSLAAVVLQMANLQLGAVEDFPFLDAPDPRQVRDGVNLLREIGALRKKGRPGQPYLLTKVGRVLARLPIDPRLGRMLVESQKRGCVSEVLVIVAALAIQDVRERPAEFQGAADEAHARFLHPDSDFLTYLNLWRYLRVQSRDLTNSAFRRMCRREFLHYLRVREWFDMVSQLRDMLRETGARIHPIKLPTGGEIAREAAATGVAEASLRLCVAYGLLPGHQDSDSIHQSLLSGLLSNVGMYDMQSKTYLGARGIHFYIWPGSGLASRTFDWVMVAELVETSRLFARTVARINPDWIEEFAGHLLKRSYSEPFWSRRRGSSQVRERATLYGLVIIADRPVSLVKTGQTELARHMFIQHALVEGDWEARHPFWRRNQQALEDAHAQARRQRDHILVATDRDLFDFYDSKLPASVTSAAAFDNWWKTQRRETPHLLDLPESVLFPQGTGDEDGYPQVWNTGKTSLPIDYHFEPGHKRDGVWVQVPLGVLSTLDPLPFEWMVPALREELVTATIRALPKAQRRLLVPAGQVAQQLLPLILPAAPDASGPVATFSSPGFSGSPIPATSSVLPEASGSDSSVSNISEASASVETTPEPVHLPGSDIIDAETIRSLHALKQSLNPAPTPKAVEKSARAGDFFATFAKVASQTFQVDLSEVKWGQVRAALPPHLRMGFDVIGPGGKVIASGRDLKALQHQIAQSKKRSRQAIHEALAGASTTSSSQNVSGEELARLVTSRKNQTQKQNPVATKTRVQASPEKTSVRKEGDTKTSRKSNNPLAGTDLAHALAEALKLPTRRITSRWTGAQAATLALSPYPSTEALVADAHLAAARKLTQDYLQERESNPELPDPASPKFTPDDLDIVATWARDRFEDEIYSVLQYAAAALSVRQDLEKELSRGGSLALLSTFNQVKAHCTALLYPGFLAQTPPERLPHLARYLQADLVRIQKARTDSSRDGDLAWQFEQAEAIYKENLAKASPDATLSGTSPTPDKLQRARWMLEELRVSLFAQTLGTSEKVSVKRIADLFN